MLQASNLSCIRGDRELFSGVGFELAPGGLLRLLGANGAGKTSLLRLLCGLLRPDTGNVQWSGVDTDADPDAFHAAMLYLGHQNALQDALTVQENLAFYAALAGDSGQALRTVPALTRMGVRACQHKLVRHLSQGQKRRAALSRLLLTQAPLWILDEPFVALDHAAILTLAEVVSEHLQQGGMVIMTSHQDVAIAARQEQSLELGA
jgi:heme exporter protein A